MPVDPELIETIERIVDSRIEPIRVHREEHDELKAAVRRIEESHARVEDELARLAAAQRETQESLLRFQRSTEERLDALTAAQARTEERLEQLAAAQARTEERLEQLAVAQARTEKSLGQLAAAQARTEDRLGEALRELRQEICGLSERLGGDLEEIGRLVVAEFLRIEEGVELPSLEGRYLRVDGEEIEVDLFGEGRRGGESVVVIGECKARVFPRELETFYRRTERFASSLAKAVVRVVYCQRAHPDAEQFAREKGIIFVPLELPAPDLGRRRVVYRLHRLKSEGRMTRWEATGRVSQSMRAHDALESLPGKDGVTDACESGTAREERD